MSYPHPASLLVFAAAIGALGLAAEPADPQFQPNATPPPSATGPHRPRAISPETAARLAATVPKYDPTRAAKTLESAPDLRETDKPRNTIVRLPPYIVQERKAPALLERDIRSPKARLELALKRHPGLHLGNFFGLNGGLALVMLAEEERLELKRELEDMSDLMRFGDPATHTKVKREVEQAFLREMRWGRSPPPDVPQSRPVRPGP